MSDPRAEVARAGSEAGAPAPSEPRSALPRPTQRYDVAILGSDLAGLVAGALLAKRGLRVLHVDHGRPHAHYLAGGHLLPTGIELLPPLRSVPALRALFSELGSLPATSRMLQPHGPGLQLALPGARLTLAIDAADRKRELLRSVGPAGEALGIALGRGLELREEAGKVLGEAPLPPLGFFERRRARRLLRQALRSLEARAIPSGSPLGPALQELHAHLSPLAGEVDPLGFLRASLPAILEPSRIEGSTLFESLRASILGHRGDGVGSPEAPARVDEIVLERGRFAGLRLEGQSSPYLARLCLASVDLESLVEALPPSRARRRLERAGAGFQASQRRFTLSLILREAGIPPGMGSLVFASGLGPAPILIHLEATRRSDGKPAPGLITATVSTVIPLGEAEATATQRVRESLEEVMPFHEEHLEHVGVAPLRSLRYQLPEGAEAGHLGGARLESPLRNLLITNDAVLPALGLEGAVLAGTRAAHLAEEKIRKVKAS